MKLSIAMASLAACILTACGGGDLQIQPNYAQEVEMAIWAPSQAVAYI